MPSIQNAIHASNNAAQNGLQCAIWHPHLQVNFSINAHGVCAVMGASGAGKTTLLRCIAGLEKQARGFIGINGTIWQNDGDVLHEVGQHNHMPIHLPAHQRAVGYVFQEPSLFPHLSVLQNIEFGFKRVPKNSRQIDLKNIIHLLGITSLLDRHPATLSGGEQQRVGIARALASAPQLLLFDEPLAALDAARKTEILSYLEKLQTHLPVPIIYVTHALDEVLQLAQQVVLLEQGKVRAAGNLMTLAARSDLPFCEGENACCIVEVVLRELDSAYQLAHFEIVPQALFDVGIDEFALKTDNTILQNNPAIERGIYLNLPYKKNAALDIGSVKKIKIMARDVSISLQLPSQSSIVNCLPAVIRAMTFDDAGQCLLELQLTLMADVSLASEQSHLPKLRGRITRKSAEQLGLQIGMSVFAQIKGAALLHG